MKNIGIDLIAKERRRQIEQGGFNREHDEQHMNHELAWAAVCYAAPTPVFVKRDDPGSTIFFEDPWPTLWAPDWDKRENHSEIRRLVIAGALIAAEIDRILAQVEQHIEMDGDPVPDLEGEFLEAPMPCLEVIPITPLHKIWELAKSALEAEMIGQQVFGRKEF